MQRLPREPPEEAATKTDVMAHAELVPASWRGPVGQGVGLRAPLKRMITLINEGAQGRGRAERLAGERRETGKVSFDKEDVGCVNGHPVLSARVRVGVCMYVCGHPRFFGVKADFPVRGFRHLGTDCGGPTTVPKEGTGPLAFGKLPC